MATSAIKPAAATRYGYTMNFHRTCFLSARIDRQMTLMTPATYNGTVSSCETADVYPRPSMMAGIVNEKPYTGIEFPHHCATS